MCVFSGFEYPGKKVFFVKVSFSEVAVDTALGLMHHLQRMRSALKLSRQNVKNTQGCWNYQSTVLPRAGDRRGLFFMATTHTVYLFVNLNTKKKESGKCSLQLLPYREESKAK